MADIQEYSSERYIEKWKMKKLINEVEAASARGVGTRTMISLLIPPGDHQISRAIRTLEDEFRTASDMELIEQQSVLGPIIESAQHRLSLHKNVVSPNGFALYIGNVVTEKKGLVPTIIDFEPFKPINEFMCICDDKFHTEALDELLQSDDEKFGFIVMDGKMGALFGTLSGNKPEVLHITRVYLPKLIIGLLPRSNYQTFCRFRKREEDKYLKETAELARQFFINPSTSLPNVDRLILAGGDEFKTRLSQSDMFDPLLKERVVDVLDVRMYHPEPGFYTAMESSEILSNGKFMQERRLIRQLIEEREQNANKCVVGFDETLKALEMGDVNILVVWENLEISRFTLKNCRTGEIVVKHLNKDEQESNLENNFYWDSSALVQLVIQEKISLVEWLVDVYKQFGCTRLELVTNSYYKRNPFFHPKEFGGIGGILH